MDIQKLCEDSHRISKEKGWLDNPRPFSAITSLFHSEVSEALEDYRNNRKLDETYYQYKTLAKPTVPGEEELWVTKEVSLAEVQGSVGKNNFKPCGIPIEFADIIIRIAQYCGTEKLDLEGTVGGIMKVAGDLPHGAHDFEETTALLHADFSMAYLASKGIQLPDGMPTDPLSFLASAWLTLFAFCAKNGIDLDKAVMEKQAYNMTRPHRHGGKKI